MPSSNGVGRVIRHPDYYIHDGTVSFIAERSLFRVHKSFLERESEVFRDLFASSEDDRECGSDAKPFTLDVTSEDFARLLWVWYNPKYSYSRQTKETWLTILRLSTRWKFEEVRRLAIRQIEKINLQPVEKISIYKEYGIDGDLLLPSYIELCKSPTLPSPAEGERLKMETVLKIVAARERAQRIAAENGLNPTSASADNEVLKAIIADLFELGLTSHSNGTPAGAGGQASNGTSATPEVITVKEPEVPGKKNPQGGQGGQRANTVSTTWGPHQYN
ncbi:hypothetical protein HYDPIDRAFT_87309 [Hydnomerulius pinastri MD-312]|nr:hypothetical protein HYDPIDRAFT_87309 [Hydnomerulius pinastri MD-312]